MHGALPDIGIVLFIIFTSDLPCIDCEQVVEEQVRLKNRLE